MYPPTTVGIVYLAALILGLGTIAMQFVLSHVGDGGDAADGHDVDTGEAEAEHELEAGPEGHDHGAHTAHGSFLGSTAGLFLSMRFWTYALLAFGMVGAALHYLHLSGMPAALITSTLSGVLAGLAASALFRALKPGVSSATTSEETIGRMARVTVPLRKGGLGKVRVEIKGKRVDLLATTDADEVPPGSEVVVVEFRGDHAHVEPIAAKSDED